MLRHTSVCLKAISVQKKAADIEGNIAVGSERENEVDTVQKLR